MNEVLLLDDDELVLMTISEALEYAGLTVTPVRSAAETFAVCRDDGPPRILVSDINLGEGDSGVDVAARLRARWPELPVIFITGRCSPEQLRRIRPDDKVLIKPFLYRHLAAEIRSIIAPVPAMLEG